MKELIKNLEELNRKAEKGGGDARIEKQHSVGKLTARERVAKLLDAGSFVETDALVSRNGDYAGVVTGSGTVQDRPVYVFAQDFTVHGGAMGQMQAQKIVKVLDLAQKTGAPVIALCDSAGVLPFSPVWQSSAAWCRSSRWCWARWSAARQ